MKKIMSVFAVALGFLWVAWLPAQAMDFKEGVHYEVINQNKTSQTQIIEYFSFYCGSCYQTSPFSEALLKKFPDIFQSYQVEFIAPQSMGSIIVQAWAAAEVLEKAPEFRQAVFHRHFVERRQSNNFNEIKAIFGLIGVPAEQFEQAYGSFAVRSLANKMRSSATNYNVNSTPTYIVNGKYKILQQGFRNSGSQFFEHMEELVDHLLTLD